MAKWEVTLHIPVRAMTETQIIEADNWGVSRSGDFCAFYHQPGTKKTRNAFHYIKTADIHEIRRLDDELEDVERLPWEKEIREQWGKVASALKAPSMEDADTIVRTPPRQQP